MPAFLAGLAVLVLLVVGVRLLATANPTKLAVTLRKTGGFVLLAVAALLLARGALPLAIPLAVFGLALLGLPVRPWFGGSRGQRPKIAGPDVGRADRGSRHGARP